MMRMKLLWCMIVLWFCLPVGAAESAIDRWSICSDGSIQWVPNERLPHDDHLEMSGQQLSVVLRYGVDANYRFHVNRSLVFPMLRMKPNKTQDNLKQRFDVNIPLLVTVNEQNAEAAGFYGHMGFKVYKRTPLDEQGNPYPLLYMRLRT